MSDDPRLDMFRGAAKAVAKLADDAPAAAPKRSTVPPANIEDAVAKHYADAKPGGGEGQ